MKSNDTSTDRAEPAAHPLALELAASFDPRTDRVLVLGYGSGRNLAPFLARGAAVDVLESNPQRAREAKLRHAARPSIHIAHGSYAEPYPFTERFGAALSTHALLHGTATEVGLAVRELASHLADGAPVFATFGSTRDPRFARGEPIAPFSSAPRDGGERGVIHAYFDDERLRAMLLASGFAIDRCSEDSAAESAGGWAHDEREAAELVHWFVRARRRYRTPTS